MIRNTCLVMLSLSLWFVPTTSSRAQTGDPITHDLLVTPFAYGVHRYEPGYWSTVGVRAINGLENDEEVLLSVFIDPHSRMQYMRKMWAPARAVRVAWLPIRVPDRVSKSQRYLDLNALRLQKSTDQDVLQQREYDTLISNYVLTLDTSMSKTAILFDKPLPDAAGNIEHIDKPMYDMVAEMKAQIDGSRVTLDLGGDFVPPMPAAYEALDQLVVCDDRIVDDSVGLHAIRHWLQQGGRMWLPLDRVSRSTVTALLGDAMGYEIIDRTELNRFTISDISRFPEPATEELWDSEVAVEFLRVATDSADVHCQINGWPAAFWKQIGNGEVLFTTMAPEGFLNTHLGNGSRVNISKALHSIGTRFFQSRQLADVDVNTAKPLLIEQIGYRIPSRALAATILLLNCVVLCAAGWWLGLRRHLEQLAWIAPVAALCATGVFVFIGRSQTQRVPASAASFQFVQVTPDTNSADVHSLTAVYSPQAFPLTLQSKAGELVVPDVSDLTNVVKRITFDDSGQASWQGVSMKPGTVRFVEHYAPISWDTPIRAVCQFGPEGLVGKIDGVREMEVSDTVVVAFPTANLAISMNDDGSFLGQTTDVLGRSHFLSDSILNDEQRRRKAVYQHLHQVSVDTGYPRSPTLFAWSDSILAPLALDSSFSQFGSSLLAIPLEIRRTPPAKPFVVPATFIAPQLLRTAQGVSAAYNARTGQWVDEQTGPMATKLRFALPKQVLPCRLSRANVIISLTAPSRTLALYGFRGGEPVLLHEQDNPNGRYTIALEHAEALELDEQGGFVICFQISGQEDVSDERKIEAYQQSSWKIEYVRVDVEGRTLD
jgi:hypothetical protein